MTTFLDIQEYSQNVLKHYLDIQTDPNFLNLDVVAFKKTCGSKSSFQCFIRLDRWNQILKSSKPPEHPQQF